MKKHILNLTFYVLLILSCKQEAIKEKSPISESAASKTMLENFNRLIENGWNHKDLRTLKDVTVKDFVKNMNGVTIAKHQNELAANMGVIFEGFPDALLATNDIVLSKNRLFMQWTFSGTNTGVYADSKPTGKKVRIKGYSTIQYNNEGKMVREDAYYNELEMLRQLGYTLNPPVLE